MMGEQSKLSSKYRRLNIYNRSLTDGNERNKWRVHPMLQTMCSKLELPKVVLETAWQIYCRVVDLKLTRGHPSGEFCIACLHISARIHHIPRALIDIINTIHHKVGNMQKIIRILTDKVFSLIKSQIQTDFSRFLRILLWRRYANTYGISTTGH